MAQLDVTTIQRGLSVWASRTGDPSPGAVDGAWGPRTLRAYEAFVGALASERSLNAETVMRSVRELEHGRRIAPVPEALANDLAILADQYAGAPPSSPSTSQGPRAPTPPLVRRGGGVQWGTALGLALGAAVVGGAAWWLLKD